MSELLKQYVDANLVNQNKTWYSINNESLGQTKQAEINLKEMIKNGEIETLDKPSITKNEIDDGSKPAGLEPVDTSKSKINPALTNKTELPQNLEELFEPLAADLGDIETHKKGGRFKIFVFGVDSRLKDNPLVKKCPYEFRHNDKKRNIRSGQTTYNEGWTVVSKKLIKNDPRTGKPWLIVSRDDTPTEDMYTVNDYVLCYADKGQYKRKKGKMVMENLIKTASVADKRQENAERMARLSKSDPKQSMEGYINSNKADQSIVKEQLVKNNNFSPAEAQGYINKLDSTGNAGVDDVASQINDLKKMVSEGKIGKTVRNAQPMTLDSM